MASDPVTLGLGLGGLLMQGIGNESARKQQNKALSVQEQLTARQIALFDRLQKRYEEKQASGEFSPERRLDQLDKDTAKYEGRDAGNLAGALRVAGYEPGDSEIGTRLDAVKQKYRSTRESLANQVRREASMDELAAMQGQQGMGSSLNAAIDIYGNRASQHSGDIQGLFPAVQALAEGIRGRPKAAAPVAAPGSSPGAGRLGSGSYMNYRSPSSSRRLSLADLRNMRLSS